jgi:transketolase
MITVIGQKAIRSGFGDGIVDIARKNPDVVALTADLAGSLKLNQFIKEFPDRFFQCGIAEANMMSIAAGMTIDGKIPFTTTFANFSTGRVYDQIRQSVTYPGKNVKICAYHAGPTLGEDGATHQILGGLGDSIAQTASKASPVPIEYVGTKDMFGKSGTPAQLLEKYGLDAAHIVAAAEKVIARKNK